MVKSYRRHEKNCPHKEKGRDYRHCNCPIHVQGTLGGKKIRKSLGTRNWQQAQMLAREMEAEDRCPSSRKPTTVEDACSAFIRDAKGRGLREPTLYKYDLLFRRLKDFAVRRGVVFLRDLDLDALRQFRETWPHRNISARKKLEALRTFFRFAHESDWIPSNPASKIRPPKVTEPPVVPFTTEEVNRILEACDSYPDRPNAVRLHALVLLLLHSGLRIRDAVTLARDSIQGDMLHLFTAKTAVRVYFPLKPSVIAALSAIPPAGPYYFWTGLSKPKSAVGDWQRALKKFFTLAKVKKAHAHRFRHTFAKELLMAGVPLERVAVLLGHQSSRVTEKHYAAWVRDRQEQLEADVRRVWAQQSAAVAKTNSTQQVRENRQLVN